MLPWIKWIYIIVSFIVNGGGGRERGKGGDRDGEGGGGCRDWRGVKGEVRGGRW